jgi:uncharacterized membrane protein
VIHDIVIKPNNSLKPEWFTQTIVIISIPSILLTVILAAKGLWMVVPFTVLQLIALIYGFRKYRKRANWTERIRISENLIVLESGSNFCEERIELPRHWSKVELEPRADRLKPNRLVLRTGMQTYEVASCLTDSERIGLSDRLKTLIGPVCRTPNI